MNTKNLLTYKSYAYLLNRTPQRVYQLVKDGFIAPVYISGKRFIDIKKYPADVIRGIIKRQKTYQKSKS